MTEQDFQKHVIESLGSLNGRFDGLETRFDGLETRFDGLEKKVDRITTDLTDFREHME